MACLEEVDTFNDGNAVVRSNVAGSSYDHVVGQDYVDVGSQVEIGGPDAENGPEGEDVGPKLAENEPHIGDNESSDDNGSEHVEVGPEIIDIWTDHVDVGVRVADVNGNGADHVDVGAGPVDVDDNINGADHVDVGPVSENGSQHAENGSQHVENGPDNDNGLDHVDVGPEVDHVEPKLEDDAFLFNIDIGSDVDEEVEEIREKERDKRHKEKAAGREQAADHEGQPVQPYNGDEVIDLVTKMENWKVTKLTIFHLLILGNMKIVSSQMMMYPEELENKLLRSFESHIYASLWGYAVELLKSNPGSIVSIQVHRNDVGQAMLFRIYVCFQALKQGWKDGCRPFIGVDGCWLKTAQKGELLVVVGRDANNQMFPIAWVVVEVECASSWRWFLKKLFIDLEHPTGEGITLMSDQKKGLVKVLVEDYPDTTYRMCARHLSTYIIEFDDNLQKLEKLSPTSTEDLLQNPVQHWAKVYFSTTPTCDVVDNNVAEAFNAWILDARCKPIISLLEDIRVLVMSRLHVKRT
ncbi:hypothetical protein V6N13_107631 [Hibiscus sabdariffa]